MRQRWILVFFGCVIACAAAPAQDKADVARMLLSRLDMARPDMSEVAELVEGGDVVVEGEVDDAV